jgi:hypothetical protein
MNRGAWVTNFQRDDYEIQPNCSILTLPSVLSSTGDATVQLSSTLKPTEPVRDCQPFNVANARVRQDRINVSYNRVFNVLREPSVA